MRVVDDDGNDVPVGDVGELWIQGPNVVKGYWGKPEATAEAFGDGWFKTGDLARVDDEGFVYIVDRAKDMVIRGGENVYCVEVEAVLFEHPDVVDAAVIGVPHQVLGEEVGAVVVARAGLGRTADELSAHVAERLAALQGPGLRVLPRRAAAPQPRGQGAQARPTRGARRRLTRVDAARLHRLRGAMRLLEQVDRGLVQHVADFG